MHRLSRSTESKRLIQSMDSTTSVQTLIDQFELMAQVNAVPAAPRSWSVTRNTTTVLPPQPKSDNSPVKEIINRMNTLRTRAQSEPVTMTLKPDNTAEKAVKREQETPVAKSATLMKPAVYQSLAIDTSVLGDEDDATYYGDESDADSTTMIKSTCYSTVPRSPSAYSTASTGSLDSLLNSLDMFLPELLQASGETSADISKIVKPTVYHSRRSSLPENLQSMKASMLIPPTSYRCASLTGEPSPIPAPKSRRSSENPAPVVPTSAKPRRNSLSTTMGPSATMSTRRFSDSPRCAPPVVSSPRARSRSNSSSVPRYMDYDSSPRFAATKAMNIERRRQLEERNRKLAADKVKHLTSKSARRPRTPEWQGRLDQMQSRLFDSKEDNQTRTVDAKATVLRRCPASAVHAHQKPRI